MLVHYLKIALRNIFKDKMYSIVNLVGLSVAIACCFLLIFWIRFELSFEDCHPKAGRIYKVLEVEKRADGLYYKDIIINETHRQLRETFPEIEMSATVTSRKAPYSYEDGESIMLDFMSASPAYLNMFSYEFIEGSKENVLTDYDVILSEEVARKLFGNESAIGKTIQYAKGWQSYTIQAVVKIPQNTHMRFDMLHLSPFYPQASCNHYILVKENVRFSEDTQRRMSDFWSTTHDTENKLLFLPLKDVHLHSPKLTYDYNVRISFLVEETYGNLEQIFLFSLFALLILTIAVINYVNTSTARAMSRIREVGVRKVTGSTQWQLILRFLSEAFVLSAASMVVAMALSKFLFPEFSMIMGNQTPFLMDFNAILICFAFCIIITILSGGYAAFYLSSFDPVTVLRGGVRPGSRENMRKILTGCQFFLSVGMLISALMIYKQTNYMFTDDTGIDRKNIIIIDSGAWVNFEDFFTVIKRENPNIIDATYALSTPYHVKKSNFSNVSWAGSPEAVKEMEFGMIYCDWHYANFFGLQVIDGEFIQPRSLYGWGPIDDKTAQIVINESFRKLMGVDNPIGITVEYSNGNGSIKFSGTIIGVVKDFNFKPKKEPITPLIISLITQTPNHAAYIKTTSKNPKETLDYIREKYLEISYPSQRVNRPFIYQTFEDEYNIMYKTELRMMKMATVFSILSLCLCMMGIVSMVSFMVEKRKKEIAIRRILGAETEDIISLFIMNFAKIIGVACVIAIPVSFIILLRWIQTYAFQTALSWWISVIVPVVVSLITAVLIAVQVFFTTRQNPAEVIKAE